MLKAINSWVGTVKVELQALYDFVKYAVISFFTWVFVMWLEPTQQLKLARKCLLFLLCLHIMNMNSFSSTASPFFPPTKLIQHSAWGRCIVNAPRRHEWKSLLLKNPQHLTCVTISPAGLSSFVTQFLCSIWDILGPSFRSYNARCT